MARSGRVSKRGPPYHSLLLSSSFEFCRCGKTRKSRFSSLPFNSAFVLARPCSSLLVLARPCVRSGFFACRASYRGLGGDIFSEFDCREEWPVNHVYISKSRRRSRSRLISSSLPTVRSAVEGDERHSVHETTHLSPHARASRHPRGRHPERSSTGDHLRVAQGQGGRSRTALCPGSPPARRAHVSRDSPRG